MPTFPVFVSESVSAGPISSVTVSQLRVGELHLDVVLGEAHLPRERRELRIVLHVCGAVFVADGLDARLVAGARRVGGGQRDHQSQKECCFHHWSCL